MTPKPDDIELGRVGIQGTTVTFEWAEKQTETTGALRVQGAVAATHVTHVECLHPAFQDAFDEIGEALRVLLADALDEWENSEPLQPEPDEDDETGMGE